MAVNFTCPHCGKPSSTTRFKPDELELVDGSYFPVLPPGEERHINERLACDSCWEAAGAVAKKLGEVHPWSHEHHVTKRLAKAVGEKR